jgi:phage tail-like protein
MSADLPVLHALLRDDLHWAGSRTGLPVRPDGALRLDRLPAPEVEKAVRLAAPFDMNPSGIAVDGCGRIYVAETAADRLVIEWPDCGFHYALPPAATSRAAAGLFRAPAGMIVIGDTLYVADSANARVVGFLVPTLEARRIVDTGLVQPTGLAIDRDARLYVLDRGLKAVMRFNPGGSPDLAYNAGMRAHADLVHPAFLAVGENDTLYVSDDAADKVFAFDRDADALDALPLPALMGSVRPRAVATSGDKIYVADATSGAVIAFDAGKNALLGVVPGFRAPVAAMAFDALGNLFVKPDLTETHLRLTAQAGCVASGVLVAGPLDAGVESDWERIAVEADVPPNTRITIASYTSRTRTPAPAATAWREVPSLDALLARDSGPISGTRGDRRFLWLRVVVESTDGRHSPTVRQIRAQTTGMSYLEHLPRMYRRDDAPTRFLERLLAFARSVMEDWDADLDAMARRFDPATASAEGLAWLGGWLGLVPPQGMDFAALRALLARVPELYARRGTLAGLRDFAEIYAGVRPQIFEAYQARRVWMLEHTSSLGFDTALAAAAPDGLVLPGQIRTDPAYAGLRGDYYAGVEFERRVDRRTDPTIDFNANKPVTPVENGVALDRFSVRWSGELKPRYSETYTFYATPASGVRLWVDGRPLIDTWNGASPPLSTASGRLLIDGDRWYAITFEMRRRGQDPIARLEWASRSENRAIIPVDCLYSVLDERADLSSDRGAIVDVGSAVVGASGPLSASDYGAMLLAEHAHLFTVVVPAAMCGDERRRAALRQVIDAEKPAHTDYHLCFPEARLRVGFQARLGIDAIVAEGPPPLRLDETALGRDSFLSDAPPGGGRVTARARLGQTTMIG